VIHWHLKQYKNTYEMASGGMSEQPPTYNEATGGYGQAAAPPTVGAYGPLPGANYSNPGPNNAGYPHHGPPGHPGPSYPGTPGGYSQNTDESKPFMYQGGYQPGYSTGNGYPGHQPSYMHPGTTITVQPQPQVIVVGGCPACRTGVLEDDFTCLGVCCAIFFFPLGILCCLAMRQRRCPNCGAVFG